jgi:hypothetical protein
LIDTIVSVSNKLDIHPIGQLLRAFSYHVVLLVLVCGIANRIQSVGDEENGAIIVPVDEATNFAPEFISAWSFVGLLPPDTLP